MGEDADDLLQDVWIDARRASTSTIEAPRSLLASVLRNRARMGMRAAARRRVREDAAAVEQDPAPAPDEMSALAEVLRALAIEFEELPRSERALPEARFVDGVSSVEIAAREGISDAAVRGRIRRALDRMRDGMDRRHGGRRESWAWVVVPLLSPDFGLSSTTGGVTMALASKSMVAGALAGLVGVGWWFYVRDDAGSAVDAQPPASVTRGAPQLRTAEVLNPDARAAAKAAWADKAARIRELRRARAPSSETPAPASGGGVPMMQPDFLDGVPQLSGMASALPDHMQRLLTATVPQLIEFVGSCIELVPEGATGKVSVRATVISEPSVGTLIEHIDVKENSATADALEQCVTESIYAFDLPPQPEGFTRELDFTVDLDERTISTGTALTPEQLQQMLVEHPELANDPEVAEALAAAKQASAGQAGL